MSEVAELESLADSAGLFGLGDALSDARDILILGGSAAGAIIIGSLAMSKLPWIKDQSGAVKAGVAVGAGVVLGVAAGRFVHRGVGAGIGAGLVGLGAAQLISSFIFKTPLSLGAQDELLLGFGSNQSVEPYRPLPGQTDGLNEIRTLEPVPGGGWAGADDSNAPWLQ